MKIQGMKIHYQWVGKKRGRQLVFLHGWSGSLQWWRRQNPELPIDYGMLRVDLPGHGLSSSFPSHPPGRTITILASVINTLIHTLRIRHPVLVGWSLGGMVALQYVLDHPKTLSALILVDTSPIGRMIPPLGILPKIPSHWIPDPRKILPLVKLWSRMTEGFLSFINKMPIRRGVAAFLVHLIAAGKKPDKRLIAWATTVLLEHLNIKDLFQIAIGVLFFDVLDKLTEIGVPTLIIHGSEDKALSLEYPELLHKNINGSILKIIEGSGHSPFLEHPTEFNNTVIEFLTNRNKYT